MNLDDTEAIKKLKARGYDLWTGEDAKGNRVKGRDVEKVENHLKAIRALKRAFSSVYGASGAAILEDLLRDAVQEVLIDNALSPNSEQDEKDLAGVLLALRDAGEW